MCLACNCFSALITHLIFGPQYPSKRVSGPGCNAQVMVLWLLAFWVLGYFALPGSLELLGLEREELTARGQVRPHPYVLLSPSPRRLLRAKCYLTSGVNAALVHALHLWTLFPEGAP